jgi:hypothetical protein
MTGWRLVIGVVVMGIAVPAILFYFLPLTEWTELFTISVTCLLGWGVGWVASDILGRPRLENRTPGGALRDLEMSGPKEEDPSI